MTPRPEFKPVMVAALEAQDAGEFETVEGAVAWFEASPLHPANRSKSDG